MRWTPPPECKPARLELYDGKAAYIESNSNQIRFKPTQKKQSNMTVHIRKNPDKSIHMAFCFTLRRKKYFLVVEENLEKGVHIEIQPENCKSESAPGAFSGRYFLWNEDNGEYGSLCSVAKPNQYLHVTGSQATLGPNPQFSFKLQFFESNNFIIRSLRNSGVGEGHKWHMRYSLRRKALQNVA